MGGPGVFQSSFWAKCRGVVFEVISGTVSRLNNGGDCIVEIGDRDGSMEDPDGVVVPGVFSFGEDQICWSFRS